MLMKTNNSFPENVEITIPYSYSHGASVEAIAGPITSALKFKFGKMFGKVIKVGTVVTVNLSNGYKIVIVKRYHTTTDQWYVLYALDDEGNLVEVAGSSNFTTNSTSDNSGSSYVNVNTSVGMFRLIILPSGWVELTRVEDED